MTVVGMYVCARAHVCVFVSSGSRLLLCMSHSLHTCVFVVLSVLPSLFVPFG